jgi:adenylate cyclase
MVEVTSPGHAPRANAASVSSFNPGCDKDCDKGCDKDSQKLNSAPVESATIPAWLESSTQDRTPLGETCVLGRSKDCQIVVQDARISRRHALIHRQGACEFWLVDLGSANGTRLNGRRVSHPSRLQDRDNIEAGGISFLFRQPTPSANRSVGDASSATICEIRTFNCWLLVADMVESTQLLRKVQADKAASLTGQWLARCNLIVEAHHGVINKYLGDGFLAYWAETADTKAEVAGALGALIKIQNEGEPQFRMVVHYGAATTGGAPSLGEESLAGKELSFAFRMEKLASGLGLGLLLSEAAARQIEPLLQPVLEGSHSVPSFEGEFRFFTL